MSSEAGSTPSGIIQELSMVEIVPDSSRINAQMP